MTDGPPTDARSDDPPAAAGERSADDEQPAEKSDNGRTDPGGNDGQDDDHDGGDDRGASSNRAETSDGSAGDVREPDRQADREPDVSVTIEGKYDRVFERLEHPRGLERSELDEITGRIESTLLAVASSGGGIRSEIYEAVDFELDDPWEIRIYLEVLEMHDLIRLRDDRWVPADSQKRADPDGESG